MNEITHYYYHYYSLLLSTDYYLLIVTIMKLFYENERIKQHTTPDLAGLRPVDPFQGILQLVRLHEEEPGELLQGLDLGPQQGNIVRHRRGYIADFAPPSAWKYVNCNDRRC